MLPLLSISAFACSMRSVEPRARDMEAQIYRVDVPQIFHSPEPRVSFHPRGLVHETLCLVQKVDYFRLGALHGCVDEILTGPFRDPDRAHERVVEVNEVDLEVRGVGPIPICPEERIVVLIRFKPSVAFSIMVIPLWTSSRERLEMSSNTLAVSATR